MKFPVLPARSLVLLLYSHIAEPYVCRGAGKVATRRQAGTHAWFCSGAVAHAHASQKHGLTDRSFQSLGARRSGSSLHAQWLSKLKRLAYRVRILAVSVVNSPRRVKIATAGDATQSGETTEETGVERCPPVRVALAASSRPAKSTTRRHSWSANLATRKESRQYIFPPRVQVNPT